MICFYLWLGFLAKKPYHTVLLRSDGEVTVCGRNLDGQCNIPVLEKGVCYTKLTKFVGADHINGVFEHAGVRGASDSQ